MSSVTEGNLGLNYGWAYGESGWNTGMDDNLVKLGFTSRNQVKGILSAPPSTPSNGDAYIVGTSPTGLFSGNFGKVAIWDRTVWLFLTPKNHEVVYNVANGCDYKYDNGWILKQEDELSPYVKVKDFTFSTGYTITDQRQCLLNLADNKYYQWNGSLPKVVPASSTPATAGGVVAGAWSDKTDLLLRSELASKSGVSIVSTNIFSVYVTEAPDDGVTDATSYFTSAGSLSEANGNIDIVVKPPITKYYLATSPTIPKNTNVIASPDWFSGPGSMPIHSYQQLSEGVDPRLLKLGGSSVLLGTDEPQTGRKWAIQGAVDITQQPVGTGTEYDSVGISGRGYARAPEARVWGGVMLGYLGPETTGGDAGVIGFEIDVNNMKGHVGQLDGVTRCKGMMLVSGGNFRPEEARLVLATRPNNGSGDNRFYVGDRFSGNSFMRAVQWFDDEVLAPAQSMGYQTKTELRFSDGSIGWSNAQNSSTGAIQSKASKSAGGFEWLSSSGSKQLFNIVDAWVQHKVPDLQAITDTTTAEGINADLYCKFNVTTLGTILGITGGYAGQTIYIANFASGSITINRTENMRTPAGAAVTIPTLGVACFTNQGGVWLFNYVSAANN